jgi:ATP-dependent Zn protease
MLSQKGRDKNVSNGPVPPRKRDMARAMLLRVLTPVTLLRASVTKLCDQSQLLIVRTILINALLIAFMFKEVLPSFTPVPSQKAPVEVAYSRFMDYCEGKKNLQNEHIDNVQVEGSKITFRLVRAETRAQRASLGRMKQQKHNPVQLSETDDLTTESAYTQTMDGTNSELIHFLRKNDIPFRASATMNVVSKQGGDFPTTLAVAGGAYYLYKNGGFSSVSKNGKKAKAPVVPISFDDIEGIDEAKHDVLELVDTLRNPEKYSLVGARAPTGLLLEGLPGTGKVSKRGGTPNNWLMSVITFLTLLFTHSARPHRQPWPALQHPWQTFL